MSQEEKTSAPKADTPAPARNGGEATPFLAGAGMVGAAGGGSGASMATHASARRPATSNGLACDLGRPAAGAAPLLASCKAYRVPWLPCCQACHGGCLSCGSGAPAPRPSRRPAPSPCASDMRKLVGGGLAGSSSARPSLPPRTASRRCARAPLADSQSHTPSAAGAQV